MKDEPPMFAAALSLLALALPPQGAPSAPGSKPASSPAPTKLEGLLAKASSDPPFVKKGLEEALLLLGAGAVPEMTERLLADAAEPWGPGLARTLARCAREKSLEVLRALSRNPNDACRVTAIEGLGLVPTAEAVAELIRLTNDERAVVWRAAQAALASLEKSAPKLGVRAAIEKKLDPKEAVEVRTRAAMTLSRLALPESERALAKGLGDREADVRAACAEALGRLHNADPRVREELVRLLDDRDTEVRKQAILALGKLRERSVCERLVELLRDENVGIRANAHWALKSISGHAFPPMPERWEEWWKRERTREPKEE